MHCLLVLKSTYKYAKNTLKLCIILVAFTIYDLLFERAKMLVVALCGASWLFVLFLGTIPRVLGNIHIFPRHYVFLTWLHLFPTQHHSLCPQCVSCSLVPSLSFPGKISHSSTLSTIPPVHHDIGAIHIILRALSMLPIIHHILGTSPFSPRLVAGWRRCLFLVSFWVFGVWWKCQFFCWLLVEVLGIFFLLWRYKAVLGFWWLLGAVRGSSF